MTLSLPAAATRIRRIRPGQWVLLGVTAALAALWLVPLAWAFATSVKPEGETTKVPLEWLASTITFDAYSKVLETGGIARWALNSLITATLITVMTVLFSAMAAYGFARAQFRGDRIVFGIIMAGIMVPPTILIAPQFSQMVSFGLVDTYWGIILPQVAQPVMVYILFKFFQDVPRELEEAAYIDGAGRWRVFFTIVIPLSRPVLAAVSIFVFIGAWNNFVWPFIIATDPDVMTLPVGLATVVQGGYGLRYAQIMAGAVLAGLPLLVLFVLFQRHIVRGIAHTGLAGQ